MAVTIQIRRGLANAWADSNPVLAEGELGVETDTRRMKIGTGDIEWRDLPYTSGATWLFGTGVPEDEAGHDLDVYLDTSSGTVYGKSEGVWSVALSLKGPKGDPGLKGDPGPAGDPGTGGGVIKTEGEGNYTVDLAQGGLFLRTITGPSTITLEGDGTALLLLQQGEIAHPIVWDESIKWEEAPDTSKPYKIYGFRFYHVDGFLLGRKEEQYPTAPTATTGRLYAWGKNDYGQLGLGDKDNRDEFTLVSDAFNFSSVVVGGDSDFFALCEHGHLYTWGRNRYGQLGRGDALGHMDIGMPVAEYAFSKVAASDSNAYALRSDGMLFVCGRNNRGQLGLGDTVDRHLFHMMGSETWKDVYAREESVWAIHSSGAIYAWGDNRNGNLAVGDTENKNTPTLVMEGDWLSISPAGFGSHFHAIRSDGALFAGGSNSYGCLGVGDDTDRHTLERVGSDTWKAVATGSLHTLGINSAGKLFVWGYNDEKRLGLGPDSEEEYHSPVQVGNDTWESVYVLEYNSYAIRSDGELFGCGAGWSGQLGQGDHAGRNTFTKIGAGPWSFLAGQEGWYRLHGLRTNGTLYSFGVADLTPVRQEGNWIYVTGHTSAMAIANPYSVGTIEHEEEEVTLRKVHLEGYNETVLERGSFLNLTLNVQLSNWYRVSYPTGGAPTITFSGATPERVCTVILLIEVGEISPEIVWGNEVKWSGAVPEFADPHKTYEISFFTTNGGDTWFGKEVGVY